MSEIEEGVQRLQSSIGASSSSSSIPKVQSSVSFNHLDIPPFTTAQNGAQIREFSLNFKNENSSKRVCLPPAHPQTPPLSPCSQIPVTWSPGHNHQTDGSPYLSLGTGTSHSRSSSQSSFLSFDSLPPLSLSPYQDPTPGVTTDQGIGDVSLKERNGCLHLLLPHPFGGGVSTRIPEGLPPGKTHRRSNSDIPFGFSTILQSSPPLIPLRGSKALDGSAFLRDDSGSKLMQLKQELRGEKTSHKYHAKGMGEMKSEGEVVDGMRSAYMNLDNISRLNYIIAENREDLDSRASGTKANGSDGSDNEATSSIIGGGNNMQRLGIYSISEKREGIKRSAGGDVVPTTRHYRSVSMDSLMGKMNLADESLKLLPPPTGQIGKDLPSDSIDASSDMFSLEFGNGMFSGAELKKIMANENLAEIALTDPKRVKRILANRQSAARSKERKMRYIMELENKVQNLQNEATALSAQLTILQRDSASLTSQNNELKFRLQAMEQQALLRDALNEALTNDVQRLKTITIELSGDEAKFSQLSINPQMYQSHPEPQNGRMH